jgi:hypothetical protein
MRICNNCRQAPDYLIMLDGERVDDCVFADDVYNFIIIIRHEQEMMRRMNGDKVLTNTSRLIPIMLFGNVEII